MKLGGGMYRRFSRRVAAAGLSPGTPDMVPVTEGDLAALPATAQRYLRFMDVVGRPRDWSIQVRLTGRFRLRPGSPWMPLDSWQYDSALAVARLFYMRIRFAGVVPLFGWDTYVGGYGRMHGKLLGLVTVVDGHGDEFDIGELVTYLNDAVLMAPSMLLTPATAWSHVDDSSFDLSLTDSGRTVTARVFLDERAAPCNFSTTDRFASMPGGLIRAEWTTPVNGWRIVDGRPLPERVSVIWHLPEGPFTYGEFRFAAGGVAYNVAPGQYKRSA
jgi:hypothetical protein